MCPGARLRVQVTVACATEPAEDGIHGVPLLRSCCGQVQDQLDPGSERLQKMDFSFLG